MNNQRVLNSADYGIHGRRPFPDRDTFVYIGRPSKWGNPYVIGKDGDRLAVVQKYREYLSTNTDLLLALPELVGMDLMCYCAPLMCHGHVLLDALADLLDSEAT